MKKIYFVTGNKRKLGEAQLAADKFNYKLEQLQLNINEIQHKDAREIALAKAKSAYDIVKKPLVINDAAWSIPALNGFPGGYMKDVSEWFTSYDFINLVKDKKDKTIITTENIVFMDGKTTKVITKKYTGHITEEPMGIGNSLENIAYFNGRTLGKVREKGDYAFSVEDYIWYEFFKWLQKYESKD